MNQKIKTPIAAIFLGLICFINLVYPIVVNSIGIIEITSNAIGILRIIVDVVICVLLFMKKRDIVLLIAVACSTLLQLVALFNFYSIYNLICSVLIFAVYALILLFAFAVCEQTVIPIDRSKIRKVVDTCFFVPAILFAVYMLLHIVMYFSYGVSLVFSVINIVLFILEFVFILTFAMWLKNPYSKQTVTPNANGTSYADGQYAGTMYANNTHNEAYCSMGTHIVLLLFTCGIWYLIWIYRASKYLNSAPGAKQSNPGCELVLCMFIPFYQIYWFYKQGQNIDALSRQKGLAGSDMTTICLILGIFIPIAACIIIQDKINNLSNTNVTYYQA